MISVLPLPTDRRAPLFETLVLRVYSADSMEPLLMQWAALEERLTETFGPTAVPLMASVRWTRTWLKHYGETVRFRFLVAEGKGQIQAITLITESQISRTTLLKFETRHLGTAGDPAHESVVVEYNSLLVSPEWRESFMSLLSKWMLEQGQGDYLQLDGFTQDEGSRISAQWPRVEVRERESKYLDLQSIRTNHQEVIAALGSSTRSNLRRKLRDYGEVSLEWAESLDAAQEIFAELVQLHQARWIAVGQPGAFASPRFTGFQQSLLSELFPVGQCVVFRVRHQGTSVGCLLLLNDRGRLLDYLSGLADFDQKPSPGLVTHYLCQCEALQRGFTAYDFLVGDKRHKDNLSTHTQILTWTRFIRPSWKSRLVDALTQIKRVVSDPDRKSKLLAHPITQLVVNEK